MSPNHPLDSRSVSNLAQGPPEKNRPFGWASVQDRRSVRARNVAFSTVADVRPRVDCGPATFPTRQSPPDTLQTARDIRRSRATAVGHIPHTTVASHHPTFAVESPSSILLILILHRLSHDRFGSPIRWLVAKKGCFYGVRKSVPQSWHETCLNLIV